jgi:hypothetical protein
MEFDREASKSSSAEVVKDGKSDTAVKTGHNGVILIPHPSDDPRDPLVSENHNIVYCFHDEVYMYHLETENCRIGR